MRKALPLLVALSSACGGSPAAPTPQPSAPTTYTLTGHLTSTATNQPLASAMVTAGAVSSPTDSAGLWRLTVSPGTYPLTISGSGLLERRSVLDGRSSHDVGLDAIQLQAPFSLDYYRQLVRDNHDNPSLLRPLRRWDAAPRVYVRTIDEAGKPVDAATLGTAADALINTAALLTGGHFGLAGLEQGVETRAGVAGWITVRWMPGTSGNECGESDVALSGGTIDLFYQDRGCWCGNHLRPRTVRHELGHAMGLWHTDSSSDLMYGLGAVCDQLPSAREQFHAGILYSRIAGNTDPDTDPITATPLTALRVR